MRSRRLLTATKLATTQGDIAMRMKWALLHTAMAWAVPVAAQTEPDSEKADGAEIVVVGSRGAPRLVTASAVPVDVLAKDAPSARGEGELSKILQFLPPSLYRNSI